MVRLSTMELYSDIYTVFIQLAALKERKERKENKSKQQATIPLFFFFPVWLVWLWLCWLPAQKRRLRSPLLFSFFPS